MGNCECTGHEIVYSQAISESLKKGKETGMYRHPCSTNNLCSVYESPSGQEAKSLPEAFEQAALKWPNNRCLGVYKDNTYVS
jgi:hypothetical protein